MSLFVRMDVPFFRYRRAATDQPAITRGNTVSAHAGALPVTGQSSI